MEEIILNILNEISGIDEVDKDIDLFKTDLLDSLGLIELLVEIEEKTGIAIEPMEVQREDFNTVNKIVKYVKQKEEK